MSMMISKKMCELLNAQVGNEFFASHTYLAMACAFEDMNLPIFAKRFYMQTEEERGHGMKIVKYLVDQDATVALGAIPEPKGTYKTAVEAIQAALDHELMVTQQINDIMTQAEKDKDYATRSFIQWFVDEQVEEVSSMKELLHMVKMAEKPAQLLQLESRLYRMMSN